MTDTTTTETTEPSGNGEAPKVKKPKPIYQLVPLSAEDDDSQVRQWYVRLINQVLEIDSKVDAGSDTEIRKNVTAALVDSEKNVWEPTVNHLHAALEKKRDGFVAEDGSETPGNMDEFVGIYLGIIRGLQNLFKTEIDTYVDGLVEKAPKPEDTLSDEDKKALMEERKALAGQIATIIEMAKTFNEFDESNPWYPPKRRGAVGARGKRALSYFTWTVDGQELPEDEQSVAGVYPRVGYSKAADLTAALKECKLPNGEKLDTTNPPREFSVTLNGHTIVAKDSRPEDEVEGDESEVEETDSAE